MMVRSIEHRADRTWVHRAVSLIEADTRRSADTHLLRVDLPSWSQWADDNGFPVGVDLYLKDESTHPTGSLKHRLARSHFLYALCNGWINETTTVIEASSGSTAVSEAYFAKLIGVPFVAVMAASTSPEKVRLIESQGGRCHFVDNPADVYAAASALEKKLGGHYIDQFTMAERATDWRGNNNIAESIFNQMALERYPIPTWVVVGAGTGGTSATLGRYLRYRGYDTALCVVDPERSVFYPAYEAGDGTLCADPTQGGSRIEGIGRPRVEPSFVSQVIDRMIAVPDSMSIAGMHFLSELIDRRVGPSTGTNLYGAFTVISEMVSSRLPGSVVTLLCDPGERYVSTYFNNDWLAEHGLAADEQLKQIRAFWAAGRCPFGGEVRN